jgi:hypothetical protein
MTAGFARRKQEWELNRSLANKDVDIADRQVAAAQTQQSMPSPISRSRSCR